jgi:hypothetical protein
LSLFLVPHPRHLEERAGGAPLDAVADEQRDDALPPQGFTLEISDGGVHVRHADDAGLRYARALLGQIREQSTDALPGLFVRDEPDFPVRGYMLDISRDRVPTRETLERLVGIMALARINQLQLYTEHTFAYRDHEIVWRNASPMTPDDIVWLDALCARNGIELVANQNCFAHMARWLEHAEYAQRAEIPEGGRAPWGVPLPPFTLAPTQDNADFVLHLLDELLPNFTSRRVNIGCDEPFDLGQGYSADDIAARGKAAVYLEHVERIARPLTERGHQVLMWGDVLRDDLALAGKLLPAGVVALPWWYEAPWSDEQWSAVPSSVREMLTSVEHDPRVGFRDQLEPLAGTEIPFWVAPGVSSWNSLVGRVDNAIGNLIDACDEGLRFGAGGVLITDWGDNGHHQPPSVSFGPLIFGGAVSWCLESNRTLDIAAALDALVFADGSGKLGAAFGRLGRMWRATGQLAFNSSPVFTALVRGGAPIGPPDVDMSRAAISDIEDTMTEIEQSSPGSADGETVKRELTAAARLARHGVWRVLRRTDAGAPDDDALRDDLREAIELQRAAWLERSRPGGLSDSLEHLESVLAQYG